MKPTPEEKLQFESLWPEIHKRAMDKMTIINNDALARYKEIMFKPIHDMDNNIEMYNQFCKLAGIEP